MEYQVITADNPHEVWARGFHYDIGKAKAETMVAEGYWKRFMYPKDRDKVLAVVPVPPPAKLRRRR